MKKRIQFKNITAYNISRVISNVINESKRLNKSVDQLIEQQKILKEIKKDNKFIKDKLKKVKSKQTIKKYQDQLKANDIYVKDIFRQLNLDGHLKIKNRSTNYILEYDKNILINMPNNYYKESKSNTIDYMLNIVNDVSLLQDLDKNTPDMRSRIEELILQNYNNVNDFKKDLDELNDYRNRTSIFRFKKMSKKKISEKKKRRIKNKLARKARRKNRKK